MPTHTDWMLPPNQTDLPQKNYMADTPSIPSQWGNNHSETLNIEAEIFYKISPT